jgi:hypothetical protein
MIQEKMVAISNYVPYLSFAGESGHYLNENFIMPKVNSFFNARAIAEGKYSSIDATKYISDLDFFNYEKVHISYFYESLLWDILKDSSGNISHTVKYCITFDREVTSKVCTKTRIKYDEIRLNKKPILYFIYIDFKEVMRFLRLQVKA